MTSEAETSNSSIISERLKFYREDRGYTQQAIAAHLNISRTAYANYETGLRMPDIFTLDSLARLYGVAIEAFLYPKKIYNSFESSMNYSYPSGRIPAIKLSTDEKLMLLAYREGDSKDQLEIRSLADLKAKTARLKHRSSKSGNI